ncbi:hypothetical protein MHU86_5283 [Fragilaria crotonensis]|nr:hypothetical protein MHU86_5283 [Fragilaria crotonensis]
MKDGRGTVVNLFDHVHNFTLDAVIAEFDQRNASDNVTHAAFDSYEKDEIMMSRLVVESLMTTDFFSKIFTRYGHRMDFKRVSGACLLIMALETCNASASLDVDEATAAFAALTLDAFPGENIADMMHEALRLIKIMQTAFSIPNNTGSRLLQKVTKTSCEEFNRKIFTLLDSVKGMEHKYKMLSPEMLVKDPDYPTYGPIGLISTLHEIYGRLITDRDWPALATKLPQSNNAATSSRPSSSNGTAIKCFRCQGPHLIKDCPKKSKGTTDKNDASEPASKKAKTDLPAWRYAEPKNLTQPLVDDDGRKWKFCTKCVCKKSGKTGMYLLSHFDHEHQDNYVRPSNEGNMAAVLVPLGIPAATTAEPDPDDIDADPIEFQGAWCASVSSTDAVLAFSNGLPSVEREIDMAALESTEEHGAGAVALAVVSHGTTDVREIWSPEWASALEREISLMSAVFDDVGDFAVCAAVASEVDADDDWEPDRPLGTFAFIIASFSRYILMAVMCVVIIPAQRVYEFFPLAVFGPWEWISRRSNPMDALPTTFQFHHPSVTTPANIAWPHLLQSTFQPWTPVWMQHFMVVMFWIAMMAWESVTYLLHDIGSDASKHVVRRERRRIAKNNWRHRHDRGRRLPALVFLPILWMAMTNVIMIPSRFKSSLPTATTRNLKSQIFHFGQHSYHRVLSLNELMVLDLGTWIQFNKLKAAYLLQKFASKPLNECQSTLSIFERNANCSVGNCHNCRVNDLGMGEVINELPYSPMLPSTNINNHVSTLRSPLDQDATLLTKVPTPWTHETELASLLVSNEYPVAANGPTIIEDEDAEGYGLLGYFDEPCVFMNFITAPVEKKPVIFDTGASLAITYDKLDFDGPLTIPKGDLRLGGMANGLKIEGVGPVTWTFANSEGGNVCVKGMAYYVPKAKARLLSPQRLFDASTGMRGRYEGDHQSFRLHLDGCPPLIVEYDDRNSLPIGYATFGAALAPHKVEPQMNLSLMDEHNQNLTGGQKLLLQWHNRFGHLNFPAIQRILRAVPFLSAKFEAASKCELHTMKCSICEFAKGHRRAKKSTTHVPNDQRTGALKVDNLKPGIQVSVDHFESRLLGRTFDSYGKASSATYKGGCIFVDHCSGFLHVEHQLGFSAVESVRAKQAYEQMALHYGVVVESYLTDSGAFKANAFVQHIREHEQRIRYCGANAHHKNGVAERAVQSVSNMARALILHASAHWKDGIDSSLWPMAVTYATYLYNHLPNAHGLCPADIFTGSTVPRHRLKDIHVWGCPVYVLDPHLQAGQKLPRWQPRSRRGVFMGFSHLHSSEVPLVLNLDTGSITPQYHVVFDDQFSTVSSVERENDPPDNWADLCLDNTTYIPTDVIEPTVSSEQVPSSLAFEWLSPAEQEWATRAMTRQDAIRGTMVTSTDGLPATATVPPSTLAPAPSPRAPVRVPSPPTYAQITATGLPLPHAPAPSVPVLLPAHASPIPPPAPSFVPSPSRLPHVPTVSEASGLRRSSRTTKGVFQKTRYIDEAFLSSMSTSLDVDGHAAQLAYLAELFTCSDTGIVNITDPRVYAAKTPGTDSDMPTFQQAMNGSEASEYINAMRLEIQTLVGQRTWEAVTRPKDKPILKGTWAFKLKRLPDGTPYRYKARFCARGDMQTEGVDFFETYAPVVQWSTIRLLLSTVLTEGWTTRQVDYTNAFAQAELKEEVYVEYPRLFGPKSGTDKVLHLLKSLYGLRQAPRTFFEKLKAGLEERDWRQSEIDPCLFMKSGMMCVVYVDDTIFASANVDDLEHEITSLGISTDVQRHTFALRNEGEVSAFLGIQIKKTGSKEFLLTQTGLIDKVLAVTKLTDCNGCDTPATVDPLHADKDGEPFSEEWAYDVVIGMLMYIAGNTRPDIAYAVHQAARFTHGARRSHAAGVKRILRYLKKTKTEGLILKPGSEQRVDCYVDADFGGLFSVEDKQDPVSVKSRTGYVITYRGAPLMWASKMQTQVALSTMEAEYIALSQSMRDLIPIREVLKEIMTFVFDTEPKITYHSHSKAFDDTIGTAPHVIPQSTVYEDNDACLKFARMPKLTPRTKHIGIPYHWFRTQVERLEIQIEGIDTKVQLGDQFTKGLPVDAFRDARMRLMGW